MKEVKIVLAINIAHELLMKAGLSEYDADMLITQLLIEEAEDFTETTRSIDKNLNGVFIQFLLERKLN